MIFLDTVDMVAPGVLHLSKAAVVKTDPAIKNTRHHFEQEDDNKLRLT